MNDKDNYESYEEIRDAMWKNADRDKDIFGEIKFRKNNRKNYFKVFLKVLSFILIAALSGGITAQYIINKDKVSKNITENASKNSLGDNTTKNIYSNSITQVSEKVAPIVVGISNKDKEMWDTPEESGSGIIFKSDGYIITNYHAIEGTSQIKVKLSNDKVLNATVVGEDPISDLAVIKVDASNLPIATFADSSKVNVGDVAIAVGNPLGEQFSGMVTAGIISTLDRKVNIVDKKTGEQTIYKIIQTDATINKENSGGALCNVNGEVIGINSLKISSASETYGVGFAINSNKVKEIIKSLMTKGKVSRPVIGIYGVPLNSSGNDVKQGILVQEVVSNSGADAAGVVPNDVISQIGDATVKNMEDLNNVLEKFKVSDRLSCKLWRNGKIKNISIVLSELKVD
ncbi:S1C family serine protease [Clostridium psychrophilum]|uniref:S1C family serine protease n=1 Tax=Clostridium psychrophilum TaxID=132926 RepID=UPI0028AE75CF|nr:trypsin-like peptidase domain-containing protein [Clostridium psychrophilum]